MIFLHVFLPILFNIGLYFYTVRYKSGIKIFGSLQNISKNNLKNIQKKNLKTFKLISLFERQKGNKKIFCFHVYGQILKCFQAYLHEKKKQKITSLSCFKMQNGYRNWFMIIH
jgi:hypothetical protein